MANSDQCLKCHQDTLDAATAQIVVHDPISHNQCKVCHSNDQTNEIIPKPAKQNQWNDSTNDKIWMEWLAESFIENTHQVALLPVSVCGTELTIKLWYQNRDKKQRKIRCPDLNLIPIKLSRPPLPNISQFHLENYNDKLLSRATLSWTTDVPCRCQLIYNFDDHEYVKKADAFFTHNHNQEIRNFNPANTKVSIRCDDTFQQHTQSKIIPLTTLPLKTDKSGGLQPQNAVEFATAFNRINGLIEISIITNQPAAISIGRVEQEEEPFPVVQPTRHQTKPISTKSTDHSPLTGAKQLNTTICVTCHHSTVAIASHPINVLPPAGMIIPEEYPLLSNGRLTCMTCHKHHSSNNEARILKKNKKELCTGCHTNY